MKIVVPDDTPKERGLVQLDLSKLSWKVRGKPVSLTNPNWRLLVDYYSELPFTSFHPTKDDMVEHTLQQLNTWIQAGRVVKTLRCDNAGENKKLEKESKEKEWQLPISFEYTARATPQQNSVVEKKFDTLASRARSTMNGANISPSIRKYVCKECISCCTHTDGLVVREINGKSMTRYEHWGGELPKFAKHLREWGEAGIVTTRDIKTSKLTNKGKLCMFVGYSPQHAGDCYRMFDPETKRIHVSRDIKWLNRLMYPKSGSSDDPVDSAPEKKQVKFKEEIAVDIDDNAVHLQVQADQSLPTMLDSNNNADDNANDKDEEEGINYDVHKDDEDKGEFVTVTRSGRHVCRPKYGVESGAFSVSEKNYYEALADFDDFDEDEVACTAGSQVAYEIATVGAGVGGGFDHTTELKVLNYEEAMQSNDINKWKEAVDKEVANFDKHKVYKPVKRSSVPADAKIVDTTWAMKKKANGTYKARCNVRGFQQIDGKHYDSHHISSPVTNDVTIRVLFVIMMMCMWYAYILDVCGAFLHGKFRNGEVIYTEVPDGFRNKWNPKVWLWLLLKTCYGLKQASYEFWVKLLNSMKKMGYSRSNADPCLYYRWKNNSLNVWVSWVDDLINFGPKEEVLQNKEEFQKQFECDDVGWMNEYVGCKVNINRKENAMKITQPVLLQSFKDEFDLPTKSYDTPAEPRQILDPADASDILGKQEQEKYRSGVGKLLHLMRWSRPEIWNAVRELSKHNGKCNEQHMKAMKRVMKYAVDTPNRGWRISPERRWRTGDNIKFKIRGCPDASYAPCRVTRKSVTGYAVFLEGVVVAVKSGMQRIVALSSAEAEVIAVIQCVQEMLYIKKVIESMKLTVDLPMQIECDNKGAVDLVNGWAVGGNSKHIDVRLNFLRELKESGVIRISWVATGEQVGDLHTKNLERKSFERHAKVHVGVDEYWCQNNQQEIVSERESGRESLKI